MTLNKTAAKSSSANSAEIPPLYLYTAIAVGVIILCLISWKVYTAQNPSVSVDTVNARETAKQNQNFPAQNGQAVSGSVPSNSQNVHYH